MLILLVTHFITEIGYKDFCPKYVPDTQSWETLPELLPSVQEWIGECTSSVTNIQTVEVKLGKAREL